MKNEVTDETVHEILILFLRTTKKFNEFEDIAIELDNGEKLFPSQLHIIEAIGSNRANKVTQLSQNFHITKGAVSQVVNKLHEKSYINKERNKDFGKEVILSLTRKGQKAFEIQNKMHKKMEEDFIAYLEAFSPQQVDSFIQILTKIEEYIDTFLKDET